MQPFILRRLKSEVNPDPPHREVWDRGGGEAIVCHSPSPIPVSWDPQVLRQLPSKQDSTFLCELTPAQQTLYSLVVKKGQREMKTEEGRCVCKKLMDWSVSEWMTAVVVSLSQMRRKRSRRWAV